MGDDRLETIRSESARIADLAASTHVDVAVPSCPDWTFRDLVLHLGEVQRFWAENVLAQHPAAPWEGEVPFPAPGEDLAGWLRSCTDALVHALSGVPAESPCWTWWGEPSTAAAVERHQVHEAAVHRWDAESAAGFPAPLDPHVATDGVAEFLQVTLGDDVAALDGSVTLVATDSGATWSVGRLDGSSASIRARASDLALLLYRRLPAGAVRVEGDHDLVSRFLDLAGTE